MPALALALVKAQQCHPAALLDDYARRVCFVLFQSPMHACITKCLATEVAPSKAQCDGPLGSVVQLVLLPQQATTRSYGDALQWHADAAHEVIAREAKVMVIHLLARDVSVCVCVWRV